MALICGIDEFKRRWKKLEYWKKGCMIGLIFGIIIGISIILCTLSGFGDKCLFLIIFWLFIIPFEQTFEKMPNGVIQAIVGYGLFIIQYIIIGALIGFIISKIKKK